MMPGVQERLTYLDVFIVLICNHDFNNEVLSMGRNGFLADVLHQVAKFHGQSLVALNDVKKGGRMTM
jgi:hypothetical protein